MQDPGGSHYKSHGFNYLGIDLVPGATYHCLSGQTRAVLYCSSAPRIMGSARWARVPPRESQCHGGRNREHLRKPRRVLRTSGRKIVLAHVQSWLVGRLGDRRAFRLSDQQNASAQIDIQDNLAKSFQNCQHKTPTCHPTNRITASVQQWDGHPCCVPSNFFKLFQPQNDIKTLQVETAPAIIRHHIGGTP